VSFRTESKSSSNRLDCIIERNDEEVEKSKKIIPIKCESQSLGHSSNGKTLRSSLAQRRKRVGKKERRIVVCKVDMDCELKPHKHLYFPGKKLFEHFRFGYKRRS
jgi:G3E family GTPase